MHAQQVFPLRNVELDLVQRLVLLAALEHVAITARQTETAQETAQKAVAVTSTLQIVALAQQTHARHAQKGRPIITDASTTLG